MTDPRQEIRSFVSEKFPGVSIADDTDIFAGGLVNSLFAMELVMFIEQQFGLQIPNDDLVLANFNTIDAMDGVVRRLLDADRTWGAGPSERGAGRAGVP